MSRFSRLCSNHPKFSYPNLSTRFKRLIQQGNIRQIFRFYKKSAKYVQKLIDIYMPKIRMWSLKILAKS